MSKRISITLNPEESARFQEFIDYGTSCTTPTGVARSLINAGINRVNYAKATGLVPKKIKNLNPLTIDEKGEYHEYYSDFLLFCALHYLEVGKISKEQFQNNLDDLTYYISMRNLENIEFDKTLDDTLTEKERKLAELEAQAAQLRAEIEAERK